MNILQMFEVAAMIGKIGNFFDQEVHAEDFWELPAHYYELLSPEERREKWFIIDPEKLNQAIKMDSQILILSEQQKDSLLSAFQILKNYTKNLPENAHFKERMLAAKSQFPPVFFTAGEEETQRSPEGRVIPFIRKVSKPEQT